LVGVGSKDSLQDCCLSGYYKDSGNNQSK